MDARHGGRGAGLRVDWEIQHSDRFHNACRGSGRDPSTVAREGIRHRLGNRLAVLRPGIRDEIGAGGDDPAALDGLRHDGRRCQRDTGLLLLYLLGNEPGGGHGAGIGSGPSWWSRSVPRCSASAAWSSPYRAPPTPISVVCSRVQAPPSLLPVPSISRPAGSRRSPWPTAIGVDPVPGHAGGFGRPVRRRASDVRRPCMAKLLVPLRCLRPGRRRGTFPHHAQKRSRRPQGRRCGVAAVSLQGRAFEPAIVPLRPWSPGCCSCRRRSET